MSKDKSPLNEIFVKDDKNPIITANDLPYQANTVFNPGATAFKDQTLLLMRVEDRRGHSHLTKAVSKNGIDNWVIDKKPTLTSLPKKHPEELWGIEDPRITYLEEFNKYIITYTSLSEYGPMVSLALSDDFNNFERLGVVMLPENKDAAIFPDRFKERWAMIHRPVPVTKCIGAHIWISFSHDLKHWGDHKVLINARRGGWWDANKIGLSAPPLRTDKGWLLLYHGVKETVSGQIYRMGLALLDLEDPTKVIKRSNEWVLAPDDLHERVGDVGNIAFSCGWIRKDNELRVYYGGADTNICMAKADIREVLQWLIDKGE